MKIISGGLRDTALRVCPTNGVFYLDLVRLLNLPHEIRAKVTKYQCYHDT